MRASHLLDSWVIFERIFTGQGLEFLISPTFLLGFKPLEALFPACGLFLAPVGGILAAIIPWSLGL